MYPKQEMTALILLAVDWATFAHAISRAHAIGATRRWGRVSYDTDTEDGVEVHVDLFHSVCAGTRPERRSGRSTAPGRTRG